MLTDKNIMSEEKEFFWTDELVEKFAFSIHHKEFYAEIKNRMKEFKKQSQLLKTEDGNEIFKESQTNVYIQNDYYKLKSNQ